MASIHQQELMPKRISRRIFDAISLTGIVLMCVAVSNRSHEWLWATMIYWLPFIVISPALCISMSFIFDKLHNRILKVLNFCGLISFEIYLVHMSIIKEYSHIISSNEIISSNPVLGLMTGVVFILISIVGAKLLSIGVRKGVRMLSATTDYIISRLSVRVK